MNACKKKQYIRGNSNAHLILDKMVLKIVIHSEWIVFAVHRNKWINMSTTVKLPENRNENENLLRVSLISVAILQKRKVL